MLKEIKTFTPSTHWADAHLEIRVHQNGVCSICGVELKWPAYVEYGGKGVRSQEVGVHCLEALVEKMNYFLIALDQEITTRGTLQ